MNTTITPEDLQHAVKALQWWMVVAATMVVVGLWPTTDWTVWTLMFTGLVFAGLAGNEVHRIGRRPTEEEWNDD